MILYSPRRIAARRRAFSSRARVEARNVAGLPLAARLHQGDEGREDERRAREHRRWELITERFASSCGRHDEHAHARIGGVRSGVRQAGARPEESLDGLALPRVKALDSKMRKEQALERITLWH